MPLGAVQGIGVDVGFDRKGRFEMGGQLGSRPRFLRTGVAEVSLKS